MLGMLGWGINCEVAFNNVKPAYINRKNRKSSCVSTCQWSLMSKLWRCHPDDVMILRLLFGICHCSLDSNSDEADRKCGSERAVTCDKGQRLELSQRWLQSYDVRCNHLATEVLPLVVFCQTSDSIHISLQRQVEKPCQSICHACCERKTAVVM